MGTSRKTSTSRRKAKLWIAGGVTGFLLITLYALFAPNGRGSKSKYLYIHTGETYEQVCQTLRDSGLLRNMTSFRFMARMAGYPANVRPGRYLLDNDISNYALVRMLRNGRQAPVRLVVPKLRLKKDLIRLLDKNLEADSAAVAVVLNDSTLLRSYGLDTATALCAVMPDTYEFYWNANPGKVFDKIAANYKKYWTEDRVSTLKKQGITRPEAIILASIVDEETNKTDEKTLVASVYLNRLRKNMKLQADPTARYAWGDFTIRRITSIQTQHASPYNTYLVSGLPPGPICTPGKSSIEAVLNAPKNDYLYFCAKGDGSGGHSFAATYEEHLKNARAYHEQLNRRGIH